MSQLEVDKIIPQSGTTLTIGDSGDTVNFADGTNLSIDTNTLYIDSTNNRVGIANASPSVALDVTGAAKVSGDLTVDTNTLKVDSTNNYVGIGTSSPTSKLHVEGSGTTGAIVKSTGSSTASSVGAVNNSGTNGKILMYGSTQAAFGSLGSGEMALYSDSAGMSIMNNNASGAIKFSLNSGSEKMRIDSSGNLLVGKTSDSSALSSVGINLRPTANSTFTADGNQALQIGRLNSDGLMQGFYKDGTQVGSIAVGSSNNLQIFSTATDHCGLNFGTNQIVPMSNGSSSDNTVDIGNGSNFIKDIHVKGGILFGSTSSDNKLDDYEEGTWTPTYVPDSGSFTSVTYASTAGEYTKIGNTVYFTFYIQTNAITVGSASGYVKIGGLPFASGGGATSNGGGTVINAAFFAGDKPFYGTVSGSEIFLYYSTGSTANDSLLDVSDLGTGGTDNVFQMMGTYITTA